MLTAEYLGALTTTVNAVQPVLSSISDAVAPFEYSVAPPVLEPPEVGVDDAAAAVAVVPTLGIAAVVAATAVLVAAAAVVVPVPAQKYENPNAVHVARLSSWSAGRASAVPANATSVMDVVNFMLANWRWWSGRRSCAVVKGKAEEQCVKGTTYKCNAGVFAGELTGVMLLLLMQHLRYPRSLHRAHHEVMGFRAQNT